MAIRSYLSIDRSLACTLFFAWPFLAHILPKNWRQKKRNGNDVSETLKFTFLDETLVIVARIA